MSPLPGPEAHLTPAELDLFIDRHGVTVKLEKALLCPCSLDRTGQARIMCPLCEGFAYTWDSPVDVKALVTTREFHKNFLEVGTWETGNAQATFKSGVLVPDFSKVTINNDRSLINDEILTRDEKTPDGRTLERIRFDTVLAVERCMDAAGTLYTSPDDFTVVGRVISWVSGRGPAAGKRYTLRYQTVPVYLVMANQPRIRRENETWVPTFCRLLRMDMATRQHQDGAVP